ncbi:hypothetical protein AAFO90_07090 [Phaeobacter sp. CAU 1743]|uniref:hypothetical protein n=1 Tax=Phaeobacter sp. CAU 1743 TaxID=3140367 RepID=UPI0023B5A11E
MQINHTFSTYTTSLFQEPKAADPAGQPAASPGPASVFSRGVNTDMNGFYSDPRVTSVGPATLSQKTQDILDTIRSLATNELKTIGAVFRGLANQDLELEPGQGLPEDTILPDLEPEQSQKLSDETKAAGLLQMKFNLQLSLAPQGAEMLSNARSIVIGEQYVGMTEEELIDHQINAMVDMQMNAIKTTFEMARSDEFGKFTGVIAERTELGEPLQEDNLEAIRADLLAKRRDEFQRGELRLQVDVFSSVHAANYDKGYATLDTAEEGLVVQPENVAFDADWTMSEARQSQFTRMFDGITVVDGEPVLDPSKENRFTLSVLSFLEKSGEIGLEYLRDARA